MLGCTPAWRRALQVKLRRASGSGFKVGGATGTGKSTMGPAGVGPSFVFSHPPAPPNVVGPRGPRSVVGLAPGQLILECSVEADPAPEIEWHRDGILLQVGPFSSSSEASEGCGGSVLDIVLHVCLRHNS